MRSRPKAAHIPATPEDIDRVVDEPWDVRVETTLTPSVFEDLISMYRKRGYKTRQEYFRWLIVRDLYGSIGEARLKAGLDPRQPEVEP